MEARVLSVTNIRCHPTYSVEVTRATDGLQRQLLYRFSAFRALHAICQPSSRLKHLPFPETPMRQRAGIASSPILLEQRRLVLDRWLSGAVAAAPTLEPRDRAALFEFLHVQPEDDNDEDSSDESCSDEPNDTSGFFHRRSAHSRYLTSAQGSRSGLLTRPLHQGDLRCNLFRLNCLGGGAGHLDRPFHAYLQLSHMSLNLFKCQSKEQQGIVDSGAMYPCHQSTLGVSHIYGDDESNNNNNNKTADNESTGNAARNELWRRHDKLIASVALNDLLAVRLIELDGSAPGCAFSIKDVEHGSATFLAATPAEAKKWVHAISTFQNRFLETTTRQLDLFGCGHVPTLLTFNCSTKGKAHSFGEIDHHWCDSVLMQPLLWDGPVMLPHHFACPSGSVHRESAACQNIIALNAEEAELTVHFGHGKLTLSAREIRAMALGGGLRRRNTRRGKRDDNNPDDDRFSSSDENGSENGDNDDESNPSSDEAENGEDDLGHSDSSESIRSSNQNNNSSRSSSDGSSHGSRGQSPGTSRGHLRFTSVTSGDSSLAAQAAPLGCNGNGNGKRLRKWGPSRRRPAWRVVEPTASEAFRSGWILMVRVLAAVDDSKALKSFPATTNMVANVVGLDPGATKPQAVPAPTRSGDLEAVKVATRHAEASAAAAQAASKAALKAEAAKQRALRAADKQASKRLAEKEARRQAEKARKKAETALAKAERALVHAQAEHQAEATQRRAAEAAAASAEEAARAAQELAREEARAAAATAAATAAANESFAADHDASGAEAEVAEAASAVEAAALAAAAVLNTSASSQDGESPISNGSNNSHGSRSIDNESKNKLACLNEASPCVDNGNSDAAPSSVVVAATKPTSASNSPVGVSHLASAWVGAAAVLAKDFWWNWQPLFALVTLATAAALLARNHQSNNSPDVIPYSLPDDVAVKSCEVPPPAPPPSVASSSATLASAEGVQNTQMLGSILNGSPTTQAQADTTTPSPPMSVLSVSSMSSGNSLLVPHPGGFTPVPHHMDDDDGVSKGTVALFGGADSASAASPVPNSPVCASSDSSSSSPSDASLTSPSSVSSSNVSSSSSSSSSLSSSSLSFTYSETPMKSPGLPPQPMQPTMSTPNAPIFDNINNSSNGNRNAFFTLRLIEHVWLPDHHPRVLAARAAARIRRTAGATSVSASSPAETAALETAADTSEAKEEAHPAPPGNRSVTPSAQPPARFLAGADGDHARALHQWQTTLHWRHAVGLSRHWFCRKPQPHFDVLKGCLEHYMCGVDRAGRPVEVIVVNAPEQALTHLADLGVTVDAAVDHFTFLQELLWRELFPSYDCDSEEEDDADEQGANTRKKTKTLNEEEPAGRIDCSAGVAYNSKCATLRLIDVQSLKFWDVGPQTSAFFRKLQELSRHYPERTWRTMVLNAPPHFSLTWRAFAPVLEPRVRAKLHVYRDLEDFRAPLLDLVEPSQLPVHYGGTLQAAKAPGEVLLNHYGQHLASGPPVGSPALDGASRPWLTYPLERAIRKAAHAAGHSAGATASATSSNPVVSTALGAPTFVAPSSEADRKAAHVSVLDRPGFQL